MVRCLTIRSTVNIYEAILNLCFSLLPLEGGAPKGRRLAWDFSPPSATPYLASLEMTMREGLMSFSLLVTSHESIVISGNKKARPKSGSFLERVKGIEPS